MDTFHLDSCKKCGKFYFRGEMVPARKVTAFGARGVRGHYCKACVTRLEEMGRRINSQGRFQI